MSVTRRALLAAALLAGASTTFAARAISTDHTASRDAPMAMSAALHPAWNDKDAASVAWLREIIGAQTGNAAATLGRCRAATDRTHYMRCALAPLALLGASGQMNATMLQRIDQDRPNARCGVLIHSLAGSVGVLGMVARSTLRSELPAATGQRDLDAASRTVEALARDTRRFAHHRAWRHACDPDTPATA
jgi:hypothetical protein